MIKPIITIKTSSGQEISVDPMMVSLISTPSVLAEAQIGIIIVEGQQINVPAEVARAIRGIILAEPTRES